MIRQILISVFVLGFFTACGPSQTAKDSQDAQENENNAQTKAANDLVQGTYWGTMTNASGKKEKYRLVVVSGVTLQNVPGSSRPIEIPNLTGNFAIPYMDTMDILLYFSTGRYNTTTGILEMSTTGNTPASGSVELHVDGKHLYGTYVATGWIATDLDMYKVVP